MSAGLGALAPYHIELRHLLEAVARDSTDVAIASVAVQHLDGKASAEFRRLVPIKVRRTAGMFFTGSALRARVLARYQSAVAAGVRVLDPACGFGDLLLAAAEHVPASWDIERRVDHVRSHLHGRDINPSLTDVATARLALWGALHGDLRNDGMVQSPITTADAFADDLAWDDYGLILLNPPYAAQAAPDEARWASGSVTAAAIFTLEVLSRTRNDGRLALILPDVLRSGSRYEKWRHEVARLADIEEIDVVGQFDAWTDVDVFVAHLRRKRGRREHLIVKWYESDRSRRCLQDIASVSVGDVVPHRHEPDGVEHPYLTVDTLPPWSTTFSSARRIRHPGRTHEPPFVALRRTSAPRRNPNATRVCGAVYTGPVAAAVENHLVVIRPADGKLETCMKLLEGFRGATASEWLDARLRLRHLTVRALREMPLHVLGMDAGTP